MSEPDPWDLTCIGCIYCGEPLKDLEDVSVIYIDNTWSHLNCHLLNKELT